MSTSFSCGDAGNVTTNSADYTMAV